MGSGAGRRLHYRIIRNEDDHVLMVSLSAGARDNIVETGRTALSDEDFADGCIRAAVGRLMVPNKTMDDVRAAYHWLGLALGEERR